MDEEGRISFDEGFLKGPSKFIFKMQTVHFLFKRLKAQLSNSYMTEFIFSWYSIIIKCLSENIRNRISDVAWNFREDFNFLFSLLHPL